MSTDQNYSLIIKMKNGVPDGHPILIENFMQCFPNIDINNLPDEYKYFERVQKPILGLYEILDPTESVYELIDNVVKDVWHVRDMTLEEKQAKISIFSEMQPYMGWTFSEEICDWEPPIPYPDDGKKYIWNNDTLIWEEFLE